MGPRGGRSSLRHAPRSRQPEPRKAVTSRCAARGGGPALRSGSPCPGSSPDGSSLRWSTSWRWCSSVARSTAATRPRRSFISRRSSARRAARRWAASRTFSPWISASLIIISASFIAVCLRSCERCCAVVSVSWSSRSFAEQLRHALLELADLLARVLELAHRRLVVARHHAQERVDLLAVVPVHAAREHVVADVERRDAHGGLPGRSSPCESGSAKSARSLRTRRGSTRPAASSSERRVAAATAS